MEMTASEDGGPYVGRRAFTLDDQDVFYGRDQEIRDLRALWRSSPLVVLHGLAGSGKTSLLQAGVVAGLEEDGEVLSMGRPFAASSFPEPLLGDHNPYSLSVLASWSPAESRTRLAQESIADFLRRHAKSAGSLLLVGIDQIEEILADEQGGSARDEFFADLAAGMRAVPNLRVLLATRTDSLSKLAPYEKQLSPDGGVRFGLDPLTIEAAVEAVRRPMEQADGRFDAGAVEFIVRELRSSPSISIASSMNKAMVIQPVQLQVVCTELWHVVRAYKPVITLGFIQANINVDRILASFCSSVIIEISDRYDMPSDQVFDLLILRFVTPSRSLVKVPEIELITAGIPVGLLRTLESEHILTADWSFGAKVYQLANDHLAKAVLYLSRSPVFGQPKLDAVAHMRIAESALVAREFAVARHHVKEVLDTVNPAETRIRADALSFLGNIAYLAGQADLAEEHYRLAAELREQLGDQSEVGRLFGAIGCIHIRQGRYVEALEELQLAVTRLPSDMVLQTGLATALWRSGQSQAAVAVFGVVLSVEPDSADALAGRAQISAERGHVVAALDDLLTLRRLRPSVSQQPEVRSAYALALALEGSSETAMATAMEEADAALASVHDSAVIFLRAARVALAGGDVIRAKELLRHAEQASNPALSSYQRAQVRRLLVTASESGPH